MVKREPGRPAQRGFTYLTALFMIAILSGGLALVGEVWHTQTQREREAELLFAGHEYRKAIERYYLTGPQRQYPRTLEDLLKDPRRPGTERYLRKLYRDPITGGEWGLVKAPDGGILGVHSLSEAKPLKTGGFKVRDAAFENAQRYADWKFIHIAPAAPVKPGAKPPAKPGPSGAPSPATKPAPMTPDASG
jgi:type II secretory pathway pseudopilin PulG